VIGPFAGKVSARQPPKFSVHKRQQSRFCLAIPQPESSQELRDFAGFYHGHAFVISRLCNYTRVLVFQQVTCPIISDSYAHITPLGASLHAGPSAGSPLRIAHRRNQGRAHRGPFRIAFAHYMVKG
jgi:hypothetical protein